MPRFWIIFTLCVFIYLWLIETRCNPSIYYMSEKSINESKFWRWYMCFLWFYEYEICIRESASWWLSQSEGTIYLCPVMTQIKVERYFFVCFPFFVKLVSMSYAPALQCFILALSRWYFTEKMFNVHYIVIVFENQFLKAVILYQSY